jgi:hypothetical protein
MSHGWWHHQHRVWNILPFLTFVNVPLSRLRGSVSHVCRVAGGRARLQPALISRLCALMRQAAQELGQRDTKRETAAFDPVEMVRRLNDGRKRAREFAIAQELEVRRAVREVAQGQAGSEPSTITANLLIERMDAGGAQDAGSLGGKPADPRGAQASA